MTDILTPEKMQRIRAMLPCPGGIQIDALLRHADALAKENWDNTVALNDALIKIATLEREAERLRNEMQANLYAADMRIRLEAQERRWAELEAWGDEYADGEAYFTSGRAVAVAFLAHLRSLKGTPP